MLSISRGRAGPPHKFTRAIGFNDLPPPLRKLCNSQGDDLAAAPPSTGLILRSVM